MTLYLKTIALFTTISVLASCSNTKYFTPSGVYDYEQKITVTDYSDINNWAAHPDKFDTADKTIDKETIVDQSQMKADVFFIHPTTLTGSKGDTLWNADVTNKALNERTDNTTILFQASAFNHAGKVYAPRYQQAHLEAYYTNNHDSKDAIFRHAYADVKAAFLYYLEHYNHDRPFILASHSQGTTHAKKLVKEVIDGETLQDRMIAAYLIGIKVKKNEFENILPCEGPLDLGCSISWRTFRKDVNIDSVDTESSLLVTNPLTWVTSDEYADRSLNKGGILRNLHKLHPGLTDAQIGDGILKTSRPKFFGNIFIKTKNYHIADINFFYKNIQENALARTQAYFKLNKDNL